MTEQPGERDAAAAIVRIGPLHGRGGPLGGLVGRLREVFAYSDVVLSFIGQDLKVRYQRSVLGFLWTLLNPLFMIAIMTVVFGKFWGRAYDFSVYLFAGLLPWNFCSQALQGAANSIVKKGSFFSKVYLPKAAFPLTATVSAFLNLLFSVTALLLLVFVLRVFIGFKPTAALLFFPVALAIFFFFVLGMSMLVACLNVYVRDTEHLVDVVLRVLFYLTPIIYPADMLAKRPKLLAVLRWNPMYHFTALFHDCVYHGVLPPAGTIGITCGLAAVSLVIGFSVFFWREREFVFLV
jgi:ABC-2 type transport system permease protein/lipopolysaccharide transport system permease protein